MIIMDAWTIAVVVTLFVSLCICLNMAGIAHGIGRLINAPREAAMLRMLRDTLLEKASWDDWQHSLQHQKSDDFHHMSEALRTMANAGRISLPGTPSYEIVMTDDWQSGGTSDMPLNVNEKAVTSFSSDETVDY